MLKIRHMRAHAEHFSSIAVDKPADQPIELTISIQLPFLWGLLFLYSLSEFCNPLKDLQNPLISEDAQSISD